MIKHTDAERIHILLETRSNQLCIQIRNQHNGFKQGDNTESTHLGMESMQTRLREIGASIKFLAPDPGIQMVSIELYF